MSPGHRGRHVADHPGHSWRWVDGWRWLATWSMRWSSRAGGSGRWPGPTGCPRPGSRSSSPATERVATRPSALAPDGPTQRPNRTSVDLEDGDRAAAQGPRRRRLRRRGPDHPLAPLQTPADCSVGVDHLAGALAPRLRLPPPKQTAEPLRYIRFEATLPNECWQADVTHWPLADGI